MDEPTATTPGPPIDTSRRGTGSTSLIAKPARSTSKVASARSMVLNARFFIFARPYVLGVGGKLRLPAHSGRHVTVPLPCATRSRSLSVVEPGVKWADNANLLSLTASLSGTERTTWGSTEQSRPTAVPRSALVDRHGSR
jgi:hypothetical protein